MKYESKVKDLEAHKAYRKRWYQDHKEHCKQVRAIWRANNRERIRETDRRAWRRRVSTPQGKLHYSMACGMRQSLKHNRSKNGCKWEILVEYTVEDLIQHLEKQFQQGMSWNNHGEWHIDHKIPVSFFDFTKPTDREFKACWALNNLQPLWKHDNLSKSAKIYGDNL